MPMTYYKLKIGCTNVLQDNFLQQSKKQQGKHGTGLQGREVPTYASVNQILIQTKTHVGRR